MARRRKGNPVHGWLVVDKPVGTGSTDIVGKARWALRAQKAGHAGTLDPLASGALAVAFGEATKTVPYVMDGAKRYEFTVGWGAATATDDLEGEAVHTSAARPSEADILAALPAFRGDIMQVPPVFSAVRVEGARAYDLARAGEVPELAARPLHVSALEMVSRDKDSASFAMTCGKGGYVRSVARDLGEALGCYGHVTVLRRLSTGPFHVDDGIDPGILDAVREGEAGIDLLPVETALAHLPRVDLMADEALRLRNGNPVEARGDLAYGETCWAMFEGEPVAVGTFKAGMIHPSRVFVFGP